MRIIREKELEYFLVGGGYGGDQDRFVDPWMKLGGCAAVTACDLSIFLARFRGYESLCPFDAREEEIPQSEYLALSREMKPYLKPRFSGIDDVSIYTDGFGRYLADHGCPEMSFRTVDGHVPAEEAAREVEAYLDHEAVPVPVLILNHRDRAMENFVWHWFLLTGYRLTGEDGRAPAPGLPAGRGGPEKCRERGFFVKTVTYGGWEWVDFSRLWNTGEERRGGMVFLRGVKPAPEEEWNEEL